MARGDELLFGWPSAFPLHCLGAGDDDCCGACDDDCCGAGDDDCCGAGEDGNGAQLALLVVVVPAFVLLVTAATARLEVERVLMRRGVASAMAGRSRDARCERERDH